MSFRPMSIRKLLGPLLAAAAMLAGCATQNLPPAPAQAETADYSYVIGAGDNVNVIVWRKLYEQFRRAIIAGRLLRRVVDFALVEGDGTVTRAIADQGLAAAVDACHLEAPTVTAAVQGIEAGMEVRVGRTSDRLRNPDNAAPDWVANALASDAPAGTWQSGDAIGLVSPIPTGALCTGCHGLEADLEPDVRASLARLYPEDQATGYAEGDTRGWFWVEVWPSS